MTGGRKGGAAEGKAGGEEELGERGCADPEDQTENRHIKASTDYKGKSKEPFCKTAWNFAFKTRNNR